MHLLLQMQTAQEPVWGQHAGEEYGRPDPGAGPEVYGPSFTPAFAKPMRVHVFRVSQSTDLLPEGRRKLRKRVLQAQLADEGHKRGDARHAHHERKVALDGLADARVAHLHRHHDACGSMRRF